MQKYVGRLVIGQAVDYLMHDLAQVSLYDNEYLGMLLPQCCAIHYCCNMQCNENNTATYCNILVHISLPPTIYSLRTLVAVGSWYLQGAGCPVKHAPNTTNADTF